MSSSILLNDTDRSMLEKMRGFIPSKIFDLHAHIYDCAFLPNNGAQGSICRMLGEIVGAESFLCHQRAFFENSSIRANLIIFPDAAMRDRSNGVRDQSTAFLKKELDRYPQFVGEIIVLPTDSEEDLLRQLNHPNIRGFKCYHVMAEGKGDTFFCQIGDYLPESAWRVAHELNLCITLHLVRPDALADPENLSYIVAHAMRYTNARLILAHAGRGFAAWTAIESISSLKGLPNVFVDLSAVCEPAPMMACIQALGSERVCWGSDFPISAAEGKCVSIGDSFLWLYRNELVKISSKTSFSTAHIGIESLQAFYHSCKLLHCSNDEICNMFFHNAMHLFELSEI